MALLLPNNTYFKIELDGSYKIYKNKTARNKAKKDDILKEIANKYNEIILQLSTDEYQYYVPNAATELRLWELEFKQFYLSLNSYKNPAEFVLIKQFYPNIDKLIPEIVETGKFGWAVQYKSLEEIYNKIKELEIFGKASEIKDI